MSEIVKWQGGTVDVQARLVPRYLWNTASIDVFLDGQPILRTGGQLKLTGSQSATFIYAASAHTAELTWGSSGLSFSFPYQLRIDGALVVASRVHIRNWPVAVVVLAALLAVLLAILLLFLSTLAPRLSDGTRVFITAEDAQNHIKEHAVVRGTISEMFVSRGTTNVYLYLDADFQRARFAAVWPGTNDPPVKALQALIFNQDSICVSGTLVSEKHVPEIVVSSWSQIIR
jgi:hypothetical protein